MSAGVPLKSLEGDPSLPCAASGGSRHSLACGCIPLGSLPLSPHGLLFSVSPPVSFIRTFVLGFRAHPGNPGRCRLKIVNYICRDSFPNKDTFTASRTWTYVLGVTIQPLLIVPAAIIQAGPLQLPRLPASSAHSQRNLSEAETRPQSLPT